MTSAWEIPRQQLRPVARVWEQWVNVGPRRQIGLGLWLTAGALLLLHCDEVRQLKLIGISLRDQKGLQIHFIPCPDDAVIRIRLYDVHGGVIGDEDDRLLWEIESRRGSDQTLYSVGSVPPGFSEPKRLSLSWNSSDRLGVLVDTRIAQSFIGFDLGELKSGLILSVKGNVEPSQVRGEANAVCD